MVKILLHPILIFGIFSSLCFTVPSTLGSKYIGIELQSTHPIANNGVGNEWKNFLLVNDQIVSEGKKSIFKLNRRAPFVIEAHAVEDDKDYPDEGINRMTFTYSDLIAIEKHRFETTVTVTENGGRASGKMAEWMFIIVITKESKSK